MSKSVGGGKGGGSLLLGTGRFILLAIFTGGRPRARATIAAADDNNSSSDTDFAFIRIRVFYKFVNIS